MLPHADAAREHRIPAGSAYGDEFDISINVAFRVAVPFRGLASRLYVCDYCRRLTTPAGRTCYGRDYCPACAAIAGQDERARIDSDQAYRGSFGRPWA